MIEKSLVNTSAVFKKVKAQQIICLKILVLLETYIRKGFVKKIGFNRRAWNSCSPVFTLILSIAEVLNVDEHNLKPWLAIRFSTLFRYNVLPGSLYRLRWGSGCKPFLLEKCTYTVFYEEHNHRTLFSQVTTCPSNFADRFNHSHVAEFKIKAMSSTYRHPGFKRVSATFKVIDTPFHIQSDDITIFRWLLARPSLTRHNRATHVEEALRCHQGSLDYAVNCYCK